MTVDLLWDDWQVAVPPVNEVYLPGTVEPNASLEHDC